MGLTTVASKSVFDRLVADLTDAAAAYYDSDTLWMTDAEYDAGLDRVAAALAEHPEWSTPEADALMSAVAGGQSAGGEVVHPRPMLSMAKTAPGEQGLADVDALVGKCPSGVVVEPKLDGLALRAVYTDGRLTLAATRGDGATGEDVTGRATRGQGRGIVGLPATLTVEWSGEVRGEVLMTAEHFAEAQQLRADRGEKPFANARNAVAGSLRREGDAPVGTMTFAAYDLTDSRRRHRRRMQFASWLGFLTAHEVMADAGVPPRVVDTAEEARDGIAAVEEVRPRLDVDIDGAVVTADADTDRDRLGAGSRAPHWAVAYKYAAEETTSTIEDIEVTTGRTGRISLRARIAPVSVGGATVTYATLHNPAFVAEQGLGVGSRVVVKRAGDVIPRVTATLDGNDDVTPWQPPAVCPHCGGEWDTSSVLWRCHSPECSVASRVEYWAARDCLDVDGLGTVVAEALVEHGLVSDSLGAVADLYDLTVDQWAGLPLGVTSAGASRTLGQANATKIVAGLEQSKTQPFNRVITGLGVRMTGRTVGRWLAAALPTMDRLRAATVEQVAAIEGLGETKATHIVDGLARMGPVIDRLAAAGVNMGAEPDQQVGTLPLAGKTVVISGTIPGYTRTTAQEAVAACGGKASSSVSKSTDVLVTAETSTSKARKAADLGVAVVDPADFERLLSDGPSL